MHPGDKEWRLNFAQRIFGLSDQQLLNMAFSDEAYFTLEGVPDEFQLEMKTESFKTAMHKLIHNLMSKCVTKRKQTERSLQLDS